MGDLSGDNTPWGRRIVICCDGTWQSSVTTSDNIPSNVTRLCRVISRVGTGSGDQKKKEDPNKKWHQLVYYDSGIGTGNLSGSEKHRQGGTGAGLAENVIEAYNFIVLNYEPGDEIFCFGFSRGAYTARAVAGLVTDIGVLKSVDMEIFPQIYRSYMTNDEAKPFRETKAWDEIVEEFDKLDSSIPPDDSRIVKVVGVWDTVGSLGIPDVAFFDNSAMRSQYGFHNVRLNQNIQHAFHALALDEHRKAFRPTLWYIPHDLKDNLKKKQHPPELKQVWFPGVHTNCGGGDPDSITGMKGDLEIMATAAYVWMLQVISPYLTIDQSAFKTQMKHYEHWLKTVRTGCTYHHPGLIDRITSMLPTIPLINPAVDSLAVPKTSEPHPHPEFEYGWGIGTIVSSFTGIFKIGGYMDRVPGSCQTEVTEEEPSLFGLRTKKKAAWIDIQHYGETHEYIHPICAYRKIVRKDKDVSLLRKDISALRNFNRELHIGRGHKKGRYFWHINDPNHPGKRPLPEWVILKHEEHVHGMGINDAGEVNFERAWYEQCQKMLWSDQAEDIVIKLKKSGCVRDFLDDLDSRIDFRVGDEKPWKWP